MHENSVDVNVEFINPIGIDKSNLGNLLHYFGGFSEDLKFTGGDGFYCMQAVQWIDTF